MNLKCVIKCQKKIQLFGAHLSWSTEKYGSSIYLYLVKIRMDLFFVE